MSVFQLSHFYTWWGYYIFLFLEFEQCLEPILGFILKLDSSVHDI